MSELLSVQHLTKSFQTSSQQPVCILNDISFSLQAGESMAVCGESGSGKSTLLFALGGLLPLDKGHIFFQQQPIVYNHLVASSEIGYVFQHYQLIEELNVEENIYLPSRIQQKTVDRHFFNKIVDLLKIASLLQRQTTHLSGGECQRIAIARTLLTQPKLILADEPTGSLDEATGMRVMDLFFYVCQTLGTSFILVTHNAVFAEKTNKVFYLKRGKMSDEKD